MELIVAANWKMHKTVVEAVAFCNEFKSLAAQFNEVEVLLCPPFTALSTVQKTLAGGEIKIGAQNMFWAGHGAYTGEISPVMLKELGVDYVILGHSERRHLFGEDDRLIRKKMEAALEYGLKPILCVGETESERDRGITDAVLEKQLQAALDGLVPRGDEGLVIAYEPVWAIGTGKAALPADAESAASLIHRVASRYLEPERGKGLRVQYGGSVKIDNIADFTALPSVQGALVGGAGLDAAAFAALILAAGKAAGR